MNERRSKTQLSLIFPLLVFSILWEEKKIKWNEKKGNHLPVTKTESAFKAEKISYLNFESYLDYKNNPMTTSTMPSLHLCFYNRREKITSLISKVSQFQVKNTLKKSLQFNPNPPKIFVHLISKISCENFYCAQLMK